DIFVYYVNVGSVSHTFVSGGSIPIGKYLIFTRISNTNQVKNKRRVNLWLTLREHLCSRLCNWTNKSLNQLYLLQKHTSLHKTNQYYKFCLTILSRQDEEYLSVIFTPSQKLSLKLSKSIMQPQSETHSAAQKRRRLILVKANMKQCGIYKVRYY
uniref:Uncharacterized protein n=1 Tax=Echinococcus canadensis TaxID=519352 RepID=A0A915EU35_9CEST